MFAETRVVNPPRRVLVGTGDGVWTAELFHWMRDPSGQWWGQVEAILDGNRRAIVAANGLEPRPAGERRGLAR